MATETKFETAKRALTPMLLLLLSLVFILAVVPVFESSSGEGVAFKIGLTAVLVFAALAIHRRHRLTVLGTVGAVIAVPVLWTTLLIPHGSYFVFSCILDSLFFTAIALLIINQVIRRHLASLDSVFGVICAYLLLGLAWAMLYMAMDRIDTESLVITNRRVIANERIGDHTAFSQLVYFSFVTMSTLGYGEIVPETPIAQTLCWMQSVTGQLYIAVLVAWIVSEIPTRRHHHE